MKAQGVSAALNKMVVFCAFQERCRMEVWEKLRKFELGDEEKEVILKELEREGFLNEGRFAIAFAEGKFRIKKWGRIKIQMELRGRRIAPELISTALSRINGDNYYETLKSLVLKKIKELKADQADLQKQKVLRYVYSKGFEPDLALDAYEEIIKNGA